MTRVSIAVVPTRFIAIVCLIHPWKTQSSAWFIVSYQQGGYGWTWTQTQTQRITLTVSLFHSGML